MSQAIRARPRRGDERVILLGVNRWNALYTKMYIEWCAQERRPAASYALFTKVRKESFAFLAKEKNTDLPSCKLCTKISICLQTPRDKSTEAALLEVLRQHEKLVENEWKWDRAFTSLSSSARSSALFVTVDGSEGAILPRLPANAPQNSLKYGLIGVDIFGANKFRRKIVYIWLSDVWSAAIGCDVWISAFLREIRIHLDTQERRHRHLVLHLDNTVRFAHFIRSLLSPVRRK